MVKDEQRADPARIPSVIRWDTNWALGSISEVARAPSLSSLKPPSTRVGLLSVCRWATLCAAVLAIFTTSLCLNVQAQEVEPPLTRQADPLGKYTSPIDAEMYLEEDSGDLQLVPDVSLREYLRRQDRSENFAFEEITVDVAVGNSVARVNATYKVRLNAGISEAVVPLALGSCQIGEEPIIQQLPDGVQGRLRADERGYRWVLRSLNESSSGVTTALKLSGKSRVRVESGRKSVRVSLPPKNCVVRVKLPPGSVDERVRMEDVIEREEVEDGVLVTISTRGGECVLSWRNRSNIVELGATEAESETRFELGVANERWTAETKLTLRWFGNADTKTIRIKKPEAARWGLYPEDDFDRFQISIEGDSILVENRDPTEHPVIDLRLEWEWLPLNDASAVSDGGQLETMLAGLTIENVDSHRGRLEMVCPASLNVIYEEIEFVRFSQRTRLADAFSRQRLLFEFSDQDFGLKLSFREEKSIPTVRPTYVVEVDDSKLVLTGWLECTFDANLRTLALELSFDGWIPQDNTAVSFKAMDGIRGTGETIQIRESTTDSTYRFSLPNFDSSSDAGQRRVRQIWRFTADMVLDAGNRNIEFAVPKIRTDPSADFEHGSGTLVLNPSQSLLLEWSEPTSTGLLPDSISAETRKLALEGDERDRQRVSSAYRFQSQSATPTWRGEASLLPQTVVVEESIELSYEAGRVTLEQDFQLQVANAALRTLEVEFENSGQWSDPLVYLDGELVYAQESSRFSDLSNETRDEASNSESGVQLSDVRKRFRLPGIEPVLGQATLTVVTEHQVSPSSDESSASKEQLLTASLPLGRLVIGDSARFVRRTIRQISDTPLAIQRDSGGPWLPLFVGDSVALSSSMPELPIRLERDMSGETSGFVVLDSWLQSTANLTERQDRFVAILRTSARQAQLKLPPEASVRPAPRIFVNGIEVSDTAGYDQSSETFTIPLGDGLESSEQVLEILYSVRTRLENWTSLAVQPPEILNSEKVGRLYWQLATPRSLHLLWNSNNLIPEWRWYWNGLCWERQSSLTEEALVSRLRATPERIPSSFNVYLMSCPGRVQNVRALVVARSVLWFPVGAAVIVIATLFLNIAWLRRPAAYLVGLGILFALALVSPDISVLLGQTTAIAMSLVLLIWTTHSAIESRLRRRSVFSSRFSSDASDRISTIQNSSSRLSKPDAAVAAEGSQ
jgi:hypothetical protein